MSPKIVQTSYLLGISLLLMSIFYLFASNWQSFDRFSKIGLSIGLILLFYLLHFILRKIVSYQHFLSNWMLVATSIVFGIALALIGQIYNSHADSYVLFLVWFIPVFLFAVITKYVPFYVLSFILAHLTIFMFMTPSSYFPEWSPTELFLMYVGIIVLNAIVFFLSYHRKLPSRTILYLSYLMFFGVFFVVTVSSDLPLFYVNNFMYMLILGCSIFYWYKQSKGRPLLIITSIFAAIYVLYKVFYWVFIHYGTWILIFLLLFAVVLVLLSMIIVGLLNKGKTNTFMIQLITILITIVATLFATLAITGLFFIAFPSATADALFFFAVLALLVPGLFTKIAAQIRYTLLGTGFLLSFITSQVAEAVFYPYLLFLLLIVALFTVKMNGIKVLIYILANITISAILIDLVSYNAMIFSMTLINASYYFLQTKENATKYSAFIIGLIYFMNLTVLEVDLWLQIIYNLGFFLIVTLSVLLMKRDKRRFEWIVSIIFWFLFLAYKYYEYLWTLVHKSILCLVLGLVFIGIAYYINRKNKVQKSSTKPIAYKLPLIIAVIILQFGFIGYQAVTSEQLLKSGTLIKLELEPVDPRSMMQGDYIILRYDISDLDENVDYELWNKKVKVVLREDNGIYEYAGFYKIDDEWNKAYKEQSSDVIINGKMYSPHDIVYGIESYFVPEGTGLDLQNEVEYANVRVGKTGNAIIESVE